MKTLARMISVAIDPDFADAHEDYPTRLTVTLKDGRTLEELVTYASGTARYPMSPAQIEEKFFDRAQEAVDADAAKKILAALRTLGDGPSFATLWPLLRRRDHSDTSRSLVRPHAEERACRVGSANSHSRARVSKHGGRRGPSRFETHRSATDSEARGAVSAAMPSA